MALALRMYHDFHGPRAAELARAPCMISILPDEGGKWDLLGKVTEQFYRVTCWCEHPDGPHPGATIFSNTPPDYQLKTPKDWVVKAAPYVSWFTMLAKTFVPVAGKVVEVGMGDMLDKTLKQHIELMGDLAKALPAGKLELDPRDELETGSIHGRASGDRGAAAYPQCATETCTRGRVGRLKAGVDPGARSVVAVCRTCRHPGPARPADRQRQSLVRVG